MPTTDCNVFDQNMKKDVFLGGDAATCEIALVGRLIDDFNAEKSA